MAASRCMPRLQRQRRPRSALLPPRSFTLVTRGTGTFGLIATNTIAQGDTRSTGLRWICQRGGEIFSTREGGSKWPGLRSRGSERRALRQSGKLARRQRLLDDHIVAGRSRPSSSIAAATTDPMPGSTSNAGHEFSRQQGHSVLDSPLKTPKSKGVPTPIGRDGVSANRAGPRATRKLSSPTVAVNGQVSQRVRPRPKNDQVHH